MRFGTGPLAALLWFVATVPGAFAEDRNASGVRNAVEKSIALLQRTGPIFMKQGACASCHHQSLPAMAVALARPRGIRVDEKIAREQLEGTARFAALRREQILQGIGIGGTVDTAAYTLLGMAAEKYPADMTTDALTFYIKSLQAADGRWLSTSHRPPSEYSDFTATALGIRALRIYSPEGNPRDYQRSIERAAAWLLQAAPKATEERTFQLLGLSWANANRTAIERTTRQLSSEQRSDGGWSQLPTLQSDAYATGQALVALHQGGGLRVSDPVYRRGVEFLLKTQRGDGAWLVATRSIPIMPYFESGFPGGPDQWISAAATGWASMALALTIDPVQLTQRQPRRPEFRGFTPTL